MKKGIIWLYYVIAIIYFIIGLAVVFCSSSIKNSDTFSVTIGGLTISSLGLTAAGLAYTFNENRKNDKQMKDIVKQLDLLVKRNPKKRIK